MKTNRRGGVGLIAISLIGPIWAMLDWTDFSDAPGGRSYVWLAISPIIFGAGIWQLFRRGTR
jgi:hypothetical protein